MKRVTNLRSLWIVTFLVLGVLIVSIGQFSPFNSVAIATAPGIPPQLTKLDSKSYLLTWTDASVVYVACYPGVKPKMAPAPIEQTPDRYVITCKN